MTECIFCAILSGKIPAIRAYEDEHLIAFDDIHPAAPTHVLVIPRRHIATLDDAAEGDAVLLGRMLWAARSIAGERGLSSYRLIMNVQAGAGQSVFHVHLHVLGGRTFAWPPN